MNRQISSHENESFEQYLQEISHAAELSESEERQLFERVAKGDRRAREQLVTAHLRLVVSIARRFRNKGLDITDIVNEGNVGLVRAVDKFDATRGSRFAPYAGWWIRQSIQHALAEQSRIVRVPPRHVEQLNRLNRLRAIFEQQNERRPNVNEIADSAAISEPQVMETMAASARQRSIDAPFSDSNPSTLLDMLRDTDGQTADTTLAIETLREELQRVIMHLSIRERHVVCAFYGINEPQQTFAEIGERYGMTRERARQIRNKAVRHIRSLTTSATLRSFLRV